MALSRFQEFSVYLLILGTFVLVALTDGLSWPTLAFCLLLALLRLSGLTLSTNAGCATLIAVAAAAPVYWFFFRGVVNLNVKDFLLAVLMVFLLSAQTGRDFAAVSSYCIWIMLAALFPSSGPQQWVLLGVLFIWFLIVQTLNEVRRNREDLVSWTGPDGWAILRPLASFLLLLVLGISVFSGVLYALLPRVPIAALHLNFNPMRRLVGFSGTVRLGEIGRLQEDRTPAFRVRFLKGTPPPVLRWRGLALADFNGTAWTNNLESWYEHPGQGSINLASDEQRRQPGERLFYEVQTLAAMDRVLFTVGIPEYLYLPEGRLRRNAESALRQISLTDAMPTYSLSGWLDPTVPPLATETLAPIGNFQRQRYLRLPVVNPRLRELAEAIASNSKGAEAIANRIESFLRTRYSYSLESKIGNREPLVDFLFNVRSGHCEYFASSMAVLLRTLKIPTRVVTGFYTALPEPVGPWHVIRSSSAHSWVEVWVDGKGWLVYDPTPPGRNLARPSATIQWLLRLQDKLVIFGEEWMGGANGLKRPNLPVPNIDWTWALLGLSLPLAWLLWRQRHSQAPTPHAAARLYERYLNEAKLDRHRAMTAREIAPGPITDLYEKARFSRDPAALNKLEQALHQWSQANKRQSS